MKRVFVAVMTSLFLVLGVYAQTSKYAVIVGTYTNAYNAASQLKRLEATLGANVDMVALQQQNGFEYNSHTVNDYHVVSIQPIEGKEALEQVYREVKEFFPDIYVAQAGNYYAIGYQPEAVKHGVAPTSTKASVPAPKIEAVAEETFFPPLPEQNPLKDEALRKAQMKKEVIPEAPTHPSSAIETPVPSEPVSKPLHLKPMPVVPSESIIDDDMILYGGIGLVLLLAVILILWRQRREKAVKPLQELHIEHDDVEDPIHVSVEPVTDAGDAPSTEPSLAFVEEEPTTPEVLESISLETNLDVVEDVHTEVVTSARVDDLREMTPRQKRSYESTGEPINKDHFRFFSGQRLLVAEDNLINQKVITSLLADTGMEVIITNNGQETLDLLEKDCDFALVLMDAHMPIMDGYEATRKIRSNSQLDHLAVIALSGDTGSDDIRRMMETGMEGHLEKPLQLPALYEILYNFCPLELEEVPPEEDSVKEEVFSDTPELHVEKGLEIAMGDEGLYHEILKEFVHMYQDSDQRLKGYIAAERFHEGVALLLDIRGIAANIGADPLADAAEALREVLLQGDTASYTARCEAYEAHLKRVLHDIENL